MRNGERLSLEQPRQAKGLLRIDTVHQGDRDGHAMGDSTPEAGPGSGTSLLLQAHCSIRKRSRRRAAAMPIGLALEGSAEADQVILGERPAH